MSRSINKPALAAALTGGLLLTASAFAATPLAQGYMLGAETAAGDKAKEAGCGAKHAEGGCGMAKMDADKDGRISTAEFGAAHKGDTSKFAEHDANKDGYISAGEMKAHHAAKKSGGKVSMEGKCGEGKCGGKM